MPDRLPLEKSILGSTVHLYSKRFVPTKLHFEAGPSSFVIPYVKYISFNFSDEAGSTLSSANFRLFKFPVPQEDEAVMEFVITKLEEVVQIIDKAGWHRDPAYRKAWVSFYYGPSDKDLNYRVLMAWQAQGVRLELRSYGVSNFNWPDSLDIMLVIMPQDRDEAS